MQVQASTDRKFADFYIVGAMKCGTTSLHHILDQFAEVFIAPGEMLFFDIDDIETHPGLHFSEGNWVSHDFEKNFERLAGWYGEVFANAQQGQLWGEDATTYLPSHLAMKLSLIHI